MKLWCKTTSQPRCRQGSTCIQTITVTTVLQDISTGDFMSITNNLRTKPRPKRGQHVMQHVAVTELMVISNRALSMGYFPITFKDAIKVLSRAGKDHRKVLKRRPISLLEISGKIFKELFNNRSKCIWKPMVY